MGRAIGNGGGCRSRRSQRPNAGARTASDICCSMVLHKREKEVPTLQEFATRFLDGHARANRQKASGVAAKEVILRVHLIPFLGARKLDAITNEDVQRLKVHLEKKAAKTVNNVLTVLSVMLKKAVEWGVIQKMPCTIRQVPAPKGSRFYDFPEFERLVTAAIV